jgi:hypothetical protein
MWTRYTDPIPSNLDEMRIRRIKKNSHDFAQVAVVLSGCGVYDGTEVHEAAAILAAITRHNGQPVM